MASSSTVSSPAGAGSCRRWPMVAPRGAHNERVARGVQWRPPAAPPPPAPPAPPPPAAAATTATSAAAAEVATGTIFTGFGFVDGEGATIKFLAVEIGNGLGGFF